PITEYFYNTQNGVDAYDGICALKKKWASEQSQISSTKPLDYAQLALRNLMAHNKHYDHAYAKVFQALSVVVEKGSIGGCKSANERAQAVNGRVAVLDRCLNDPSKDNELMGLLKKLAIGSPADINANASAFNREVHKQYNQTCLYGFAAFVSFLDQGAPAKLLAWTTDLFNNTKKAVIAVFSSNYGEESPETMSNLASEKASAMQAHKGMAVAMVTAWNSKSCSEYRRSMQGGRDHGVGDDDDKEGDSDGEGEGQSGPGT
ncbi:MAG: hypothetical protein ACHP6H_03870, partial [Legionellales bacterium]